MTIRRLDMCLALERRSPGENSPCVDSRVTCRRFLYHFLSRSVCFFSAADSFLQSQPKRV